MLLVIHIIFALSSFPLMVAAVANEIINLVPNRKLFPTLSSISFVGLVSTGTLLIVVDHAKVLSTCLSGLAYLLALALPYFVYRKLAAKYHE